MPRSVFTRVVSLACIPIICFLCIAITHTPATAEKNATQLFSPFTPQQDPNRAVYAVGVLFRANLADIVPDEETKGMVRYPGPLRRLGLRVHAGQKVRIIGLDGGLRLELNNGEAVECRRVKNGYKWSKAP